MKYRTDFVTNSSSSSYICDICGAEEYSYDTPEWLTCCENDHSICYNHLNEEGCPVCNLQAYAQNEMVAYLLKTRNISKDEVFAEIKKVNKRRKKLYNHEYIQHVFIKFNLTEDEIMKEIRDRFVNWHEYVSYIEER